jgi:hypothetical protein
MPITYLIAPTGRTVGYILGAADWLSKEGGQLLGYFATT